MSPFVSAGNPQPASAPNRAARRAAHRATKVGTYGSVAAAAWVAAALTSGLGVAAADAGDTSASSPSTSSAADASTSAPASTRRSTVRAAQSSTVSGSPRAAGAGNRATTVARPAAIGNSPRMAAATGRAKGRSAGTVTVAALPTAAVDLAGSDQISIAGTDSAPVLTLRSGGATARAVAAASITATASAAATSTPGSGVVNFLNTIVTTLLDPFLNPPPATPGPIVPMAWAFLGWVRRDLFNQAPTITYNQSLNVQTGQTVTGNVGASDAEGDVLTYTVTSAPQYGTVEIDQATGNFAYTPDATNYNDTQTDSFTVVVSDGKINLLSLFTPHVAQATEGVSVLPPSINRVILTMDPTVTKPVNPRYSADGNSVYFAATPAAGGRQEIYQINVDGTNTVCLTCGVATDVTSNLGKPIPFSDGTGRLVVLVDTAQGPAYDIYEDGPQGAQLIPITSPAGAPGVIAVGPMREARISPDGTMLLFSRITLTLATGALQIVPVVGNLVRGATTYEVTDARVVFPVGEGKQWTPDGKGVLMLGGSYDEGNADDIQVNMETGEVTRTTYNLDYDEDLDMSPNLQWLAVGSTRNYNALTPMTRIVRPSFLPAYVSAPVYGAYSTPVNVSNQEWLVSVVDEQNRVNGLPMFVTGDGWAARSMPSWNADGSAVTFWESGVADTTQSRLVIVNLNYTTSVGQAAQDRTTPNPTWAPTLSTYVPAPTPLPPVGTYNGDGGGTAVVSEAPDPNNAGRTIRTVLYTNYVNEEGMILNGTEGSDYLANRNSVHYFADLTVTGTHTGYLHADAIINPFQQSLTGFITSELDGDVQTLPNQAQATQDQQNA